ncbi:uncharacterized protein LOC131036715 [Cryptomeria japonica]|uniref:uncharacterized protein LOC131036715 n=1 Tax=Cryptomeria japonica TaxID=3369 RepID=UPI0027D9E738|nr:uncharacterized protein LOC131036715 [Cryptomeria japonica]XP_057824661.2 uncharacterized protein LOC131036715 [Cryptomeria japonica]
MSSKEEEATQAAADRIKAAAKGLSHTQAEQALTASTSNANAYVQKGEGPSRWQERKEAKRQMYLMSTEKAVKLGVRKDLTLGASSEGAIQHCQKCFQPGHCSYECKNDRVHISYPSRTQQLKNPKLKMKISISYELSNFDNPQNALDLQHGLNRNQAPEKEDARRKNKDMCHKKKNKRKRYSDDSSNNSSSEASVFSSGSDISTEVSDSESDTSESNSSDSEVSLETSFDSDSEEERNKRKHRKRGNQKYSSLETETESDSDFGDCRRKRRQHQKRRHGR